MNIQDLIAQCFALAESSFEKNDVSHDKEHTRRVLNLALMIACHERESVDIEVLILAAIFHDLIVYQKNHHKRLLASDESAERAVVLMKTMGCDEAKIQKVAICIRECSYTKNLPPSSLESAILQDADSLESVGAIALMCTFSSGGAMNRPLYNADNPLAEDQDKLSTDIGASIELIPARLLRVSSTMHTVHGKRLAQKRHRFTMMFWEQYKAELIESGIIEKPILELRPTS